MAGVSIQTIDGQWIQAISVNIGTASTMNLVAGVAGQIARIYKLMLVSAATNQLTFKDGSTALTGAMALTTAFPYVLPMDGNPWLVSSKGNAINATLTSAANVSGMVWFTQQ